MSSLPHGLSMFPPVVRRPLEPHVNRGNAGRFTAAIAVSQETPKPRRSAFTLVELLVVMAIIILILGLTIPAFNSLKGSRDITTAVYDIAGTLEQARAYAMANRTYVWVGFFEEDGSKSAATSATTTTLAGIGRVVVCVVASKDGTRYRDTKVDNNYPAAFGAPDSTTPPTNPVTLIQLNKLIKIDNTHLTAANVGGSDLTVDTANSPDRPIVSAEYQVGDAQGQTPSDAGPFATHYIAANNPNPVKNPTTFPYPLGSNAPGSQVTPQYTFTKIIEFNPQGEASKIVESILNGTPAWMEIAVVPARGNVVDPRYLGSGTATKSAAVVQVGGLNGRMHIFLP